METETLSNQEVIDFSKEHLISIKLDAWNDSVGKELFAQYDGRLIPLLIFLNSDGEEIERIIGYENHTDFIEILNNVVNNDNTFMSLFEKYKNGNRSSELINQLSIKNEDRYDESFSSEICNIILNDTDSFSSEAIERAELYFAKLDTKSGNLDKINKFIEQYKDSDNIVKAYHILMRYYRTQDNVSLESQTYQSLIELFPDDPSILNGYAWRMSELDSELDDALEKVNKGLEIIEKSDPSYSHILDTKAEVLWKMGFFDKAIKVIDEAISIDNESQYYKDQKLKFLNSKEGI